MILSLSLCICICSLLIGHGHALASHILTSLSIFGFAFILLIKLLKGNDLLEFLRDFKIKAKGIGLFLFEFFGQSLNNFVFSQSLKNAA